MPRTINAVFQNGVFCPKEKVFLSEHQEVEITIKETGETGGIAYVAENSGAFDYLSGPGEDIYSITDGEPV